MNKEFMAAVENFTPEQKALFELMRNLVRNDNRISDLTNHSIAILVSHANEMVRRSRISFDSICDIKGVDGLYNVLLFKVTIALAYEISKRLAVDTSLSAKGLVISECEEVARIDPLSDAFKIRDYLSD